MWKGYLQKSSPVNEDAQKKNRCPKLLAVMEYKLNQQNIIACL